MCCCRGLTLSQAVRQCLFSRCDNSRIRRPIVILAVWQLLSSWNASFIHIVIYFCHSVCMYVGLSCLFVRLFVSAYLSSYLSASLSLSLCVFLSLGRYDPLSLRLSVSLCLCRSASVLLYVIYIYICIYTYIFNNVCRPYWSQQHVVGTSTLVDCFPSKPNSTFTCSLWRSDSCTLIVFITRVVGSFVRKKRRIINMHKPDWRLPNLDHSLRIRQEPGKQNRARKQISKSWAAFCLLGKCSNWVTRRCWEAQRPPQPPPAFPSGFAP